MDKVLSGIKAVQTLSRLNRSHPEKRDVFVLDFENDADTIQTAFADYYRTTILGQETDPNKLHDLKTGLDATQVAPRKTSASFGTTSQTFSPRCSSRKPSSCNTAAPGCSAA